MRGPDSYIFTTVIRFSFFVINVFAIYLLLRGHNLPGGGFIGGLASAIALVLLSLALGMRTMHRVLQPDLVRVAALGLLLAALTSTAPVLFGRPFLEHAHVHIGHVPLLGDLHVGTPLLFDVGVYFVVVGVAAKIIFILARSTEGLRALEQADEALYSARCETPLDTRGAAAAGGTDPEPAGTGGAHAG